MYHITNITAYQDETLSIDKISNQYFTYKEIEELFKNRILLSELKEKSWIVLGELGKIRVNVIECVEEKEKLKQIENLVKEVAGKETAHDTCQYWYHQYLINPTEYSKEKLKEAYESVPAHERCYLGDMDTRDTDLIRILYSNEKREV